MIVRTPPHQRKRRTPEDTVEEEVAEDRRLVVYNGPTISSHQPSFDHEVDHSMVCTYQCRQMIKSEFMDTLRNSEKQLEEYRSRVKILTTELCKIEEDKKKLQDRVCFLEQDLAASKGREKALEERLLNEVDDSLQNYQSQAKCISELEIQLEEEVKLRKNAEMLATSAKENSASLEQKVTDVFESGEREKRHFLNNISDLQDKLKQTSLCLNRELEQMKLRADCALEEADSCQKQLDELRVQLIEVRREKIDLEKKLSSSPATLCITPTSEDQSLVKHLQDALRNYEAEVQEARKLKSFHADVGLLKEKLLDEKVRRERAEEQLLQLREIELDSIKLKDEMSAIELVVHSIPGISSFQEIPMKVAALQQEAIDNMKKVGDLKERIKELEIALESAIDGTKQVEIECAVVKDKDKVLISEASQLKQMLRAVTEERDSIRRGLLTSNMHQNANKDNETDSESLAEKMGHLLSEKDICIKELEANLQDLRKTLNHKHEDLGLANERLNIELKRIKSLEREGDRLRAEISLLESKVGHGDYVPANTKVLRMMNTSTADSEAKLAIEALRAELNKTQAKLQAVEELKGQSDAGILVDANISEKLAQLKGQIATLEKREERYKTVFADKISVFRRACCSLFGYKIVMDDQQRTNGIPVTRFTLQSIYAQTDDEKLEFEYEAGNTNILSNDYTSHPEISHQVDIFIQKLNSIPAFTANLTVESFNKRTLS